MIDPDMVEVKDAFAGGNVKYVAHIELVRKCLNALVRWAVKMEGLLGFAKDAQPIQLNTCKNGVAVTVTVLGTNPQSNNTPTP